MGEHNKGADAVELRDGDVIELNQDDISALGLNADTELVADSEVNDER